MAATTRTERRMLAGSELEAVNRSHYPEICALSPAQLADLAKRLRDYRDKA